jgi:heme-degrading monooxygenase HmoA
MILVLVTLRARSPQAAHEMCRISRQSFEMYQEPGWLGGRCVICTRDPRKVLIIGEWGSRSAWEAWQASPARVRVEQEAAPLRVGSTQIEVYADG